MTERQMTLEKTEQTKTLGGVMKTNMKAVWLGALALMLAMSATSAWASDPNPSNDGDSFTIRITPNVDYGVDLTTGGANWSGASSDLDVTMDLGTTLLLESYIAVEMTGNFNNQELDITAAGNDTWTLDTDDAADEQNALQLYGLFATVSANSPIAADFNDDTHLITAALRSVGQVQADEGGDTLHQYELLTGHAEYADVDSLSVGDQRVLWLRADTPPTTTVDVQQGFTVTVTARTGTGL